jgi:F0F1-type ATP synthase membrane subunit c/vacuolar-type H+-ATPase subunit K
MTAVAPDLVRARAGTVLRVTPLHVLHSEWTKFRSLRSTGWTLLIGVVLMVGLGALLCGIAANNTTGLDAGATATSTSLTGTFFAQLALGVLGALMITGEYSTGMIRASLTVVPTRLPVLWAKLVILAAAVTSERWSAAVAETRVARVLPLAGRLVCWFFSTTTTLRVWDSAALDDAADAAEAGKAPAAARAQHAATTRAGRRDKGEPLAGWNGGCTVCRPTDIEKMSFAHCWRRPTTGGGQTACRSRA